MKTRFFVFLLLFFAFGCEFQKGTFDTRKRKVYLDLTLTGKYPERGVEFPVSLPFLFEGRKLGFTDLLLRLDRARYDNSIAGVVVRIKAAEINISQVFELRKALSLLRQSGKDVLFYLEYGTMRDIYLSSCGSKVYIHPAGIIDLLGFRVEPIFFKGTMKKLGISWDVIQLKEFKDAFEPFVNETLSTPSREVYNSILNCIYERFVSDVAEGRRIAKDIVVSAVDEGLLAPFRAKELGLVDSVLYEGQFDSCSGLSGFKVVEISKYNARPLKRSKVKLGVIYALGSIHLGRSAEMPFGSPSIGSLTFVKNLESAVKDKDIAAIIIRVNSPGGSSLASDIIYEAIKEANKKKPVIVSMGSVAASGGYYISMPACSIVATPFSFTGSIGVIFAKPNLHGLYDKLGITRQSLVRGKRATIASEYRSLTEEEKNFLFGHLRRIYDEFVMKVAESRGISLDSAEALAKGRLWLGEQAKKNGLVDVEGGFLDAIAIAKLKANIPFDEEPELEFFPRKKKIVEYFIELSEIGSTHSEIIYDLAKFENVFMRFEPFEPLMIFPLLIEVK